MEFMSCPCQRQQKQLNKRKSLMIIIDYFPLNVCLNMIDLFHTISIYLSLMCIYISYVYIVTPHPRKLSLPAARLLFPNMSDIRL